MASAADGPAAERLADYGIDARGLHRRWADEIDAFQRERRDYVTRAEKIEKRYANEHRREERRFALLWANVEVLKPTLYVRVPVPRVFRRFRDRDPIGRVAATLLERVLSVQIERGGDFHHAMMLALHDYLVVGQGTVWCDYLIDHSGERAAVSYVPWRDIGWTAGARSWPEVTALWRAAYLTRDELIRRFGPIGERVPLDREAKRADLEQADGAFAKATIYEVWDSETRTVVWLHKDMMQPLDARPYPLSIRGKFPCPRPLLATLKPSTTIPIPDFVYYQDQAFEIDELTARIASLSRALRLVGFIPGEAQADIQRGLDSSSDVALVPVEAWALGGQRPMDNAIAWLPVAEVAAVLKTLVELREALKRDAFEVSGLSDILRGQTKPTETATAQSIKAQWGTIRVRERQQEMARFVRDAIEVMADIICAHFDPASIMAEANAEALSPDTLTAVPQAVAMLKGPHALRAYRIDIETDSTIEPDEAEAKQRATEMLSGVSAYLQAMMPMLAGVAQAAPHAQAAMTDLVGGLLGMGLRAFRGAEEAEELVDAAMEALARPVQVPAQAGPSPEEIRAQAEMQKAAAEMEARRQIEAAKAEVQARLKAEELAHAERIEAMRIAAEDRRHAATLALERERMAASAAERAAERDAALRDVDARIASEVARAVAAMPRPEPDPRIDGIDQAITELRATLSQAMQRLAELADEVNAPAEIVRGPDGRAVGVRRGKRERRVVRDETGRAIGLR